jgi:hypothetical protein
MGSTLQPEHWKMKPSNRQLTQTRCEAIKRARDVLTTYELGNFLRWFVCVGLTRRQQENRTNGFTVSDPLFA